MSQLAFDAIMIAISCANLIFIMVVLIMLYRFLRNHK